MAIITRQYKAHQVKTLLADGKSKEAFSLLYDYCIDEHEYYEKALMLYNSLNNLELENVNGIITKEEFQERKNNLIEEARTLANDLAAKGITAGTEQESAIPNTPYVYPPYYKIKFEFTWPPLSIVLMIAFIIIWAIIGNCK